MKKIISVITLLTVFVGAIVAQNNYPPANASVAISSLTKNPIVTWTAPSPNSTIYYCNEQVNSSFGFVTNHEINYGILYTPVEIQEMGLVGQTIKSISFYCLHTGATYRAKIWTSKKWDSAVAITEAPRSYDNGWNTLEVPTVNSYTIKANESFIVGITAGNYDAATQPAVYDKGPVNPNASMILITDGNSGRWQYVGNVFPGNLMIKFNTYKDQPNPATPSGYIVYRSDANAPATLNQIGVVSDTLFEDADWSTLTSGTYNYAVKADYSGTASSAIYTPIINNNMEYKVTFLVKDDMGQPVKDANLGLMNEDSLSIHEFRRFKTDESGIVAVPFTWRGDNVYVFEKNGYTQTQPQHIIITRDSNNIPVTLSPNKVYKPNAVRAAVQDANTVNLTIDPSALPKQTLTYLKQDSERGSTYRNKFADSSSWGIGFTKEQLTNNGFTPGTRIYSVYLQVDYPGQPYYIKFWNEKQNPVTLYRQAVTFASEGWKEVLLTTPFEITTSMNYLIIGATTFSDTTGNNLVIYPITTDNQKNTAADVRLAIDSMGNFSPIEKAGAVMIKAYSEGTESPNTTSYGISIKKEDGSGKIIVGDAYSVNYSDNTWNSRATGRYVYEVKALYSTLLHSDSIISNTVGKGLEYPVQYTLKNQFNAPVDSANVVLKSNVNEYVLKSDLNGVVNFSSVLNDTYTLKITKTKYENYVQSKTITANVNENIAYFKNRFRVIFNIRMDSTTSTSPSSTYMTITQGDYSLERMFSQTGVLTIDTAPAGTSNVLLQRRRDPNYNDYNFSIYVGNDTTINLYYPKSVSVKKSIGETEVKLYPNPTTSKVVLEAQDIENVLIFNMMGQRINLPVYHKSTENVEIDFNALKGTYIIEVRTSKGKTYQRIIVE